MRSKDYDFFILQTNDPPQNKVYLMSRFDRFLFRSAAWASGWETPGRETGLSCGTWFSLNIQYHRISQELSVTYLEVGARARLDVVRGKPLPHLNQGQTFLIIHVKHRLVDGG